MAEPNDIIAICQNLIGMYPNNCAGFVRAVASKCGVLLFGNANEIVQFLSSSSGRYLPNGIEARKAADRGDLVIGGLSATGHGHVVIIVADPVGPSQYPYAFWGQYHALEFLGNEYNVGFTRGHGRLNFAFKIDVLDKLIYRSYQPSFLLTTRAQPTRGYILPR